MKMPFTPSQFFSVFKDYNNAVFPAQIAFYLLALLVLLLAIKKNPRSYILISTVLSSFWLWMGLVYHLLFFSAINKMAYGFAGLFVIQGLLFLWLGIIKKKLSFALKLNGYGVTGLTLILFSLAIYPVIGYSTGHGYPIAPTFGLPCPTTIFTFGMLLLLDRKCPWILLIIPLLWSVIGVGAAIVLGVYEDTGLLVSGIVAVTLILVRNKKMQTVL